MVAEFLFHNIIKVRVFINIKYFLLYSLLFSVCFSAFAKDTQKQTEILSTTKVIITDGDTIKFNNKKIRLHGIDTPEIKQLCKNKNGEDYKCGVKAKLALINLISNQQVKCSIHGKDRYKRLIASCLVKNININEWLVKEGWALAYRKYSKDYVDEELFAKNNKLGLWKGVFLEPLKWRRLKK
jgi:endonuclease YncB( thermonuclease family)